ncbi:YeeE/YedE family protein [Methylocapsa sp. S129]|uniref:YeeE/YedE family protein n=1 Tax=Methylocapsa sp. S129 TaxID=1641869 RepID=UPI00131DA342|nr:YeeE/YedE family protein [Methylocapsa sp. S129]
MRNIIALAVGLIFGAGLCLSGMTEPAKVLGFLDLAGLWDPSLAFVMGGAIAVALVAFGLAKRRRFALDGEAMQMPTARAIDPLLVAGSLIFGIGWGLAGICPGPAIVDVGFLNSRALVFVVAMAVGMLAQRLVGLRLPAPGPIGQDA